MASRPQLPVVAAAGIWLVSVIGFAMAALVTLGVIYQGWFDCNAELVTIGAKTNLSRVITLVATLMPVGIAFAVAADRRRLVMFAAAAAVAGIELWLWWSLVLTPVCSPPV